MRPSKIRVAKYEYSATSKWVVEGLKNNKGKRSRKFFRSRIEADDFARNVLQEQRHLFDALLGGTPALEVPLEGNGKSLCSLRIRISDALKWLADQFRAGNTSMEPYARLKRQLRYSTHGAALRLHLKRPHRYRPIPHLDPALRARLQSALQRPDLKPTTRAKIEAVLNPRKPHILPTAEHGSPEQ